MFTVHINLLELNSTLSRRRLSFHFVCARMCLGIYKCVSGKDDDYVVAYF